MIDATNGSSALSPASPAPSAATGPLACPLKAADFASSAEVRWCPGCGDYSILANVRKVLAKLGCDKSKTVFVSGIGCSSRFPYYMNTYGFHSIHGRAPTLATGLKLARPDLSVWITTGDGDALSIGGNHLIHLLRRNVDVKILLFNNRIYGLTKGQYSPTSERGTKSKSSPDGSLEPSIRPLSLALASGASFAARAIDSDPKFLEYVLERAAKHVGTAFVEIYQNCVIFNNGAYAPLTDRDARADRLLYLEDGKPLTFGLQKEKGLRLTSALAPEIIPLTPAVASSADPSTLLQHDERNPLLAYMLSQLSYPDFPEPVGVLRSVEAPVYDQVVHEQIASATQRRGTGRIQDLVTGTDSWNVG